MAESAPFRAKPLIFNECQARPSRFGDCDYSIASIMERSKTLDALAEQGPILKMGYE
jgi:hypothetical protein